MSNSELPTSISSLFTTIQQTTKPVEKPTIWFVATAINILMIFAIVLGNSLVLVTTWSDKRLHQPNKYFIACLALADFLVGVFSVPIRVYLRFHGSTEIMKVEFCRFWTWIDISCEVASVVTLTVISVDRYIKISKPFQYRSLLTTFRCAILIAMIWLISIIAATLGLFSYNGSNAVVPNPGYGCSSDNPIYMTVVAGLFFFAPLIVIIVMYALIFFIAHRRQKMCRKGTLGQSHKTSKQSQRFGREFFRELKTVRMLLLVVLTFLICWGPFFIIYLLNVHRSGYVARSLGPTKWGIVATVFFELLPYFNSLCNPIIYACFDREYNKAFKFMLRRIFCCGQDHLILKLSKSSSTQSFRLKELRSRRTSAGQQQSKEMHENDVHGQHLL